MSLTSALPPGALQARRSSCLSLSRLLAIALGLVLVAPIVDPSLAEARKKKADDEEESADEDSSDSSDSDDSEEAASDDEDSGDGGSTTADGDDDEEAAPKKKKKKSDDAEPEEDKEFVKQNLSGHDLGTKKKSTEFEKDRFFVDKVDTEKTEKGTLIQGSLTSSSFLWTESGGPYAGMEQGSNAARFSRVFTELRLQTDFRHLSGGRWDARIDARARIVNTPEETTATSADRAHVQSGFNGTNEYDLRELWLFRSGKRSDIFFGRQFVPDLAGVKFDGLRIDYAKSAKMTLIGFGGLYPLRGSRSLTTDYSELKSQTVNGSFEPAGRFVGAGGFGGAYRTINTYGAVGGVVLYPVSGEQPRVFATSSGYYRSGSILDIYHFALVDLYGSQVDTVGLTNLSVGANVKPSQRLRLTAAINRVDVDTLAVQANAFLNDPSMGGTNVENETYFRRLATNTGRAGVSVGLGEFQRFEVSVNSTYRARKAITIPKPDNTELRLQGTKGVEVGGSILDRRSIADLRLGFDVTRTIGIGSDSIAFMRSNIFAVRAYAGRELKNGHGEWEAEVTYTTTKDSAAGTQCAPGAQAVVYCYGSSSGSIISAGGNLYYRINRDWMALGTLFVTRQHLTYYGNDAGAMGGPKEDPSVLGLSGFGRISYRF